MGKHWAESGRCIVIALVALCLSGCIRLYEPRLDVSMAVVSTPTGSFELVGGYKPGSCWWPVGFEGAGDGLGVMFSPFPPCELVYIGRGEVHTRADGTRHATGMDAAGITIDASASWYQRNDNPRVLLDIASERMFENGAHFEYAPPQAITGLHLSLIGGGLNKQVAERVRDQHRDRHRFHIEFDVDGEPHSLDVEFRLRAVGSWTVGVPGMP